MAKSGASGRKPQKKLEVDLWVSVAGAIEDQKPVTPQLKKEILMAHEGVEAASEVVGTEAQLLLAPQLPALHWMFKGKFPLHTM